jgi:hypothetical protein
MAKSVPIRIDVADLPEVRDRLRWAVETIGNLRRENEALRAKAHELLAIANVDQFVDAAEALARSIVAGPATPDKDDDD